MPHEVEAKVSGAHILLKPASAGTGLIAGGVVRTILEVAGIKNALSKSLGSSNKTNTAYATIAAFGLLAPASKWVTTMAKPAKVVTKAPAKAVAKPAAKAETVAEVKAAKVKPAAKQKPEDK